MRLLQQPLQLSRHHPPLPEANGRRIGRSNGIRFFSNPFLLEPAFSFLTLSFSSPFDPGDFSMSSNTRRVFLMQVAACGTAALAASSAHAQAKVDEKDPQAVALGYVADTTKADAKKFPKHTKDQKCNNCALYQGKATDAWGGCPLFGTKQVAGAGWCSAWAKKG